MSKVCYIRDLFLGGFCESLQQGLLEDEGLTLFIKSLLY